MAATDTFQDVTFIFKQAAQLIPPGEGVFMENYSLHDAMGAIEIGEPRMDSGVTIDDRPAFDSLTPLLPEEICWIIDRSLAAEMLWHTGAALSQTVYTLHYVHHLLDINPDFLPSLGPYRGDAQRPVELLTIVLRANTMGLLKCCDFAWRELSRNNVYEAEDWHSDKCDVSLLEAIQPEIVLQLLEEAIAWLRTSPKVDPIWREPLILRTTLRKCLLSAFSSIPEYLGDALEHIALAQTLLRDLRDSPALQLPPDSPATYAFDFAITSRLPSYMPLRTLTLPPQQDTWNALSGLVNGWLEVAQLSDVRSLMDWQFIGLLRTWSPLPRQRIPYMRSLVQTVFSDGNCVLMNYPTLYVVEAFFDTGGIRYGDLCRVLEMSWTADGSPPLGDLEGRITRLVIPQIWALWGNQPRLRRKLMNSLFEWHQLYHELLMLSTKTTPKTTEHAALLARAADTALLWRLDALREFVFSGFQLELYARDERAFAYWYAVKIIDAELQCLERIQGSAALPHLHDLSDLLRALQLMASVVAKLTTSLIRLPEERLRTNFYRRYKWTLKSLYMDVSTPDPVAPIFDDFLVSCKALTRDTSYVKSSLSAAHERLSMLEHRLMASQRPPLYASEFSQFLQKLQVTCNNLGQTTTEGWTMHWSMMPNPWFPNIIIT